MIEMETIYFLEGRPYDENVLLISVLLADIFYFTILLPFFFLTPRLDLI